MLKWIKSNFNDDDNNSSKNSYDQVRSSLDAEDIHQQHRNRLHTGSNSEKIELQHGAELFDSDTERTPFMVFAYLFFIIIASVLGMGILGLPVKLDESGFTPFLGSYTLCYIMQILAIFFIIEILQRCYAIIRGENPSILLGSSSASMQPIITRSGNSSSSDGVVLHSDDHVLVSEETDFADNGRDEVHPKVNNGNVEEEYDDNSSHFEKIDLEHSQSIRSPNSQSAGNSQPTPNLHYLGLRFLGKTSHRVFIFAVVLHFSSILISYALAAAMAYSKIIVGENKQTYFIVPLILIFTAIVLFGSNALQHIITFFTFTKGVLLVAIVLITGVVAQHVGNHISNDWSYIGKSFLISTVALGGASGVVPVVFPKIIFSRREMYKCYLVVFSSLTTVFLLNICWCWFLLRIIPQMPNPADPNAPSLYQAAKNSQIATIPLMKVIQLYYPQYLWIAWAVDIFIMISITISYITVATGYKQMLDGFSLSWRSKSLKSYQQEHEKHISPDASATAVEADSGDTDGPIESEYNGSKPSRFNIYRRISRSIKNKTNWINYQIDNKEVQNVDMGGSVKYPIREYIIYFIAFGFVLLVAMANPRGFLAVMEGGASLGLNLQTGVFATLMLNFSRKNYSHFAIPLPLHNYIFKLRYIVLTYFSFAVVYDIFELIWKIFT